jgi:hypothetical protein
MEHCLENVLCGLVTAAMGFMVVLAMPSTSITVETHSALLCRYWSNSENVELHEWLVSISFGYLPEHPCPAMHIYNYLAKCIYGACSSLWLFYLKLVVLVLGVT